MYSIIYNKKFLGFGFVLAFIFSCQYFASTKQKVVVNVGFCGDYPPFDYVGPDGRIQGINFLFLHRMLKNLQEIVKDSIRVIAVYIKVSFEQGLILLKNGKIDIFAGSLTPTLEREKNFIFLGPIAKTKGVLVYVKSPVNKIGLQVGTVFDDFAMANFKNVLLVKMDCIYDLLFLITTGTLDGLIINFNLYEILKKHLKVQGVKLYYQLLPIEESICFAIRKEKISNNDFDNLLKENLLSISNDS